MPSRLSGKLLRVRSSGISYHTTAVVHVRVYSSSWHIIFLRSFVRYVQQPLPVVIEHFNGAMCSHQQLCSSCNSTAGQIFEVSTKNTRYALFKGGLFIFEQNVFFSIPFLLQVCTARGCAVDHLHQTQRRYYKQINKQQSGMCRACSRPSVRV